MCFQKEETPVVTVEPPTTSKPESDPTPPPAAQSDTHLSPESALEEPEYCDDVEEPEPTKLPEAEDGASQVEIPVEDTDELEEGEILDDDDTAMLKYKYLEGKWAAVVSKDCFAY